MRHTPTPRRNRKQAPSRGHRTLSLGHTNEDLKVEVTGMLHIQISSPGLKGPRDCFTRSPIVQPCHTAFDLFVAYDYVTDAPGEGSLPNATDIMQSPCKMMSFCRGTATVCITGLVCSPATPVFTLFVRGRCSLSRDRVWDRRLPKRAIRLRSGRALGKQRRQRSCSWRHEQMETTARAACEKLESHGPRSRGSSKDKTSDARRNPPAQDKGTTNHPIVLARYEPLIEGRSLPW